MASQAKSAQGTTLTRDGHLIAEQVNFGGPKLSAGTIDVTNHDSTGGYDEFIAGSKSGGEVTLEGNFIPGDTDGQIGLLTDFGLGTVQDFVMTFPTALGASWTFSGIVTAYETTAPAKDKAGFKATIKVSGAPVLGVSASTGLTGLSFDAGTLVPVFATGTLEYVLNELTAVTTVVITPTAAGHTIVASYPTGSQTIASGVASSAIPLGAAGSVTTITITATQSGKVPKIYTLHVARAAP